MCCCVCVCVCLWLIWISYSHREFCPETLWRCHIRTKIFLWAHIKVPNLLQGCRTILRHIYSIFKLPRLFFSLVCDPLRNYDLSCLCCHSSFMTWKSFQKAEKKMPCKTIHLTVFFALDQMPFPEIWCPILPFMLSCKLRLPVFLPLMGY